jgi:hypothetical protein
MGDFDVCDKKKSMNITIKGKMVYLQTTYELRFWGSVFCEF